MTQALCIVKYSFKRNYGHLWLITDASIFPQSISTGLLELTDYPAVYSYAFDCNYKYLILTKYFIDFSL